MGFMIMASHQTFSGQIKCLLHLARHIYSALSMEKYFSLLKIINVRTNFSPHYKHCNGTHGGHYMEGMGLKFTPVVLRPSLRLSKHVWAYGWHFLDS